MNEEELREYKKKWAREYRKKHPEKIKLANKKNYEKHKIDYLIKAKERRFNNLEKYKQIEKETRKKNRNKINKYNKLFAKRPDQIIKNKVRKATWWKYGSPIKGYEYHHEEPYEVDKFIIVIKEDHAKIHNGF